MAHNLKLSSDSGTPLDDSSMYRTLVGRLPYLTNTRPDLSFAVQQLSQFVQQPTDIHLRALHRVLRYLKGSPGRGLRGMAHQLAGQGAERRRSGRGAQSRAAVGGIHR